MTFILLGLTMVRYALLGLSALVISIGAAAAQNAPPSYEADPSVYKVIFEDQNFRVISATWKKSMTGQTAFPPACLCHLRAR
jgi:hypothetical protein